MADTNDQEIMLISIHQKNGNIFWKIHNGVNGNAAEQILKNCAETQTRVNIKNEILAELKKPQIVKPTIEDIKRVN